MKLVQYADRTGLPDVSKVLKVCPDEPRPKVTEIDEGCCLVKNLFLSLDPAIRGWMTDMQGSYLPPLKLGKVMRGGSVGIVLESRSKKFTKGDFVNCVPDAIGWAQYGIAHESLLIPIKPRKGVSIRAYAGVLGGTGLTAYFGLFDIGKPQKGETVIVSAAAGAVGSVAAQLAKHVCGCRVIGIAGGSQKCQWLKRELGIDEAVDYKSSNFATNLKSAVGSKGANVIFDNVGGEILDTMLKHLAKGARVVLSGSVSTMNDATPKPISNIMSLIVKSASMRGFTLFDYSSRYEEAFDSLSTYLREGRIKYAEDIVRGLDHAPKAFLKLFGMDGGNFGKLVVDLHFDPSADSQKTLSTPSLPLPSSTKSHL